MSTKVVITAPNGRTSKVTQAQAKDLEKKGWKVTAPVTDNSKSSKVNIRNDTPGASYVDNGKNNGFVKMTTPNGRVASVNARSVDKYFDQGYTLHETSQSINQALQADYHKENDRANAAIKNGTYAEYARSMGYDYNPPSEDGYDGGGFGGGYSGGSSYSRADELARLEAISRGLSDNYFNTQKAQIEKMLAQKLTDLQKAYDAAIAEGDISVREAERQFEAQKQELEQAAYQQAEATRAYGNEMGIQNSQQMMGLQQGDNARMNSLSNQNASTRDARINDIRDRINAITKAKDLDIAMANTEYGYNMLSAAGQAEQMHGERVFGVNQEDYQAYRNQGFTRDNMSLGHQFDLEKIGVQQQYQLEQMMVQHGYSKEMQEIVLNNDLAKMAVAHGYDLSKMDKDQINVLERMSVENQNLVGRMNLQQGFDLEKMGINFENELTKMAKQFGYEKQIQSMRNSGQLQMLQAQINAEIDKENRSVQRALDQLARQVDPNSDEYKYAELEIKRDLQSNIEGIYAAAAANTQVELILGNPDLPPRGSELEAPTDWSTSDRFGLFGNLINYYQGYDEKLDEYNRQQGAISDLERLLGTGGGYSGINLNPWAFNTTNPWESNLDNLGSSIDRGLDNYQNYFNSLTRKIQSYGK